MKLISIFMFFSCAVLPFVFVNERFSCHGMGELVEVQVLKPSIRSGRERILYSVKFDVNGTEYFASSFYTPSSSNQRYWSDFDRKIAFQWLEKNKIGAQAQVKYHCWFPRFATASIDNQIDWTSQTRVNAFVYFLLFFLINCALYLSGRRLLRRVKKVVYE